jgi:hypothetical protein
MKLFQEKKDWFKEPQELDGDTTPEEVPPGWCVYLLLELQRKLRRDDFTWCASSANARALGACHATSPGFCKAYFRLAACLLEFLFRRIFPDHIAPPPILFL